MCLQQQQNSAASDRIVLPSDVRPDKYSVHLKPDLEALTFTGFMTLNVTVLASTTCIHLHVKDLAVFPIVTYQPENDQAVNASEVSISLAESVCVIRFTSLLPLGSGKLTLEFSGCLNDKMVGFYRSGYTDVNGKKRFMATTQLEAIDARRMFPCVDEPAVKAVFELKITAPADLNIISNMPESSRVLVQDSRHPQGLQEVEFMPSPKMSSYLVACCVGHFEFVQGMTRRGTLVRVLCTPGKVSQCKFALDVGIRTLEFYEEFFDLIYPLPKLDMIGVPDFAMGAMENWGLVTYREIDLLCDLNSVSVSRKQRLASVITHELAHQWFGNLVTMEWWDDLWLNEGFATFMQTYCLDKLFPNWKVWDQYILDDLERARGLDGLRSSHPIQVPIPRAEDVEQVFDAISYSKGACVVRMVFSVLGEDVFKSGLRLYMKRHAYSNTRTNDLWKSLQDVCDNNKNGGVVTNVEELMRSWTEQMGYPVLKVKRMQENSSTSEWQLEQEWFVADGSKEEEDLKKKWIIPLFYQSRDEKINMEIVSEKLSKISLDVSSVPKFNFGEKVLMRVEYLDKEVFAELLETSETLPVCDKVGLLCDVRAFARCGKVTVVEFLRAIKSIGSKEDNVDVWNCIESSVNSLDSIICTGLGRAKEFAKYVLHLAFPLLKKISWDSSPSPTDSEKRLRACLLRLVGMYCSPTAGNSHEKTEIVTEARRRFSAYRNDRKTNLMTEDTRTAITRIVLSNCESEEEAEGLWKFLKNVSEEEDTSVSQTERLSIYSAIGFVKGRKMKKETLNWCLKSEKVKTQDFFYPMSGVRGSGEDGADEAWKWLCENWDEGIVKQRLAKAAPSLLSSVLQSCAAGSVTVQRAEEIQQRFGGVKSVSRTVANIVEATKANAAFVERSKHTDAGSNKGNFWESLCK